ncbi:E3 ubiquitin-protein ligase RNF126-like [Ananas comosus]|uniref:E3 ubiquitin-protein ligase RNF126-like n=1 Tax=Ananas comosus TaxID=4615 RepID=A0A6P5FNC6_ANACO|nr:E3 ubiquitin-protein ligase RNF126-like [Ananas comosus]
MEEEFGAFLGSLLAGLLMLVLAITFICCLCWLAPDGHNHDDGAGPPPEGHHHDDSAEAPPDSAGGTDQATPPHTHSIEMTPVEAAPSTVAYPPPTSPYVEEGAPDVDCMICLEIISVGMEVMVFPCQHFVHQHCGANLLRDDRRCPYCRQSI